MNLILKGSKQMPYYTNMKIVFEALKDKQKELNWLITDTEISTAGIRGPADGTMSSNTIRIYNSKEILIDFLNKKSVWISGEALTELIFESQMQFIWGVFSGFPKNISIDVNKLEVEPYADGNRGFWVPNPRIQHPLAAVEIVCFDSTLILLLTKDEDLGLSFKKYFTDAIDLSEYNQRTET